MTDHRQPTPKPPPCPGCGGSGQTSFFGGESRFMLTWEDCPDCCGTGVLLDETEADQTPPPAPAMPEEQP
jgi:DnaJ-class molecular chaperone